jgi:hypothetical protein
VTKEIKPGEVMQTAQMSGEAMLVLEDFYRTRHLVNPNIHIHLFFVSSNS